MAAGPPKAAAGPRAGPTTTPHGTPDSLLKKVEARFIFDSLGYPTLEVDVWTAFSGESFFRASVPTAISLGVKEAKELRDDNEDEFDGKHVTKAVGNANTLGRALIDKKFDVSNQAAIDKFLKEYDGTEDRSRYGTLAMIGISMAVCRAGAAKKNIPLYKHIAELAGTGNLLMPVPLFTVINGGKRAQNSLTFQEIMIMPTGAATYRDALSIGCDVHQALGKKIDEKYGIGSSGIGDNGAYAPPVKDLKETFKLLRDVISEAGHDGKVDYAVDCGASDYCIKKEKKYNLEFKNPKAKPEAIMEPQTLAKLYCDDIKKYKIVSMEDPFDEEDLEAWPYVTKCSQIQIVSNDLTASNPKFMKEAIDKKAANCLLLKLNQTGTVSEAIEVVKMAKEAGWSVIVSQRSGETEDSFIADLAVGLGNGQIKAGAPVRYERLAKYNQLLRIEKELGEPQYIGANYRQAWVEGESGEGPPPAED